MDSGTDVLGFVAIKVESDEVIALSVFAGPDDQHVLELECRSFGLVITGTCKCTYVHL